MNIGKYGLWVYIFTHQPGKIRRIHTHIRIIGIQNGKYIINPLHIPGHTLEIEPEKVYIIERKNS